MSASNASFYEIPLTPDPQRFSLTLAGKNYQFSLNYREAGGTGWVLDISDSVGTPLVFGAPLVTGTDLLLQYEYLGIGGSLLVYSDSDLSAVPTFNNLGIASHLLFVTGIPEIEFQQPEPPLIPLASIVQPPPVQFVLPNPPTNVIASNFTDFTVAVSWTEPTIGTLPFSYEVQYSIDEIIWVTFGLPVSNPFTTVTGLSPATLYYFRVAALNSAGTGPFSIPTFGTTTSGNVLPGPPTHLMLSALMLPGAPTNLAAR